MENSSGQIMEVKAAPETNQQKVTSKKGGLRTMPFIIANETFEKVATIGLQMNMVTYLITEYHMDPITGASVLFLWSAISHFLPVFGAFLADSYMGRFRVIAYGSVISLLGLTLLWLTAVIPKARPPYCDLMLGNCEPPKTSHLALLYSSFVLMFVGAGGIRPCSLAFGADQFNEVDSVTKEKILRRFFNWYYVSIGVSVTISATVIVYIQEAAGWVVGFGIPVGLMFLSAVMFFLGSSLYTVVNANKSLFTGLAQAAVAAWKNKHLALPPKTSDGSWFNHKDSNQLLIAPTNKLRFLNKACIIRNPEKDMDAGGLAMDPWSLCTATQVEQLKALIKVLPIWSTSIMVAVTLNQQVFSILQARTMDRRFIKNFKIPPATYVVFAILSMAATAAIYDVILVPLISKVTKRRRGLSLKTRMGVGVAITCAATAVSAIVESKRRKQAIREGLANNPLGLVNMSAMWLVPQYCLHGVAEAFDIIGQIEFYYSQFPESMSSIAMALVSLGFGVGNLVASLIVTIVSEATKKGGKVSWVSKNINRGHYDYYYWLLTILSVVNVFYYILCSWLYGSEDKDHEMDHGMKEEDKAKYYSKTSSPYVEPKDV